MSLPESFRKRFVEELNSRGVNATCGACGNGEMAILDQAILMVMSDLSGETPVPPPQIPTGAAICTRCGHVRMFALGALGLLAGQEKAKEQE